MTQPFDGLADAVSALVRTGRIAGRRIESAPHAMLQLDGRLDAPMISRSVLGRRRPRAWAGSGSTGR